MQNYDIESEIAQAGEYGKFDTAAELLKAYNALEAEFTKRCQLIKRLQAELDALRAQDAETPQTPPRSPQPTEQNTVTDNAARQSESECEAIPFDAVMNEIARHTEEYVNALCAIPQIMDACVAQYKKKRLCGEFVTPPLGGSAVVTPVKRPKTLMEAKILADSLLGAVG